MIHTFMCVFCNHLQLMSNAVLVEREADTEPCLWCGSCTLPHGWQEAEDAQIVGIIEPLYEGDFDE